MKNLSDFIGESIQGQWVETSNSDDFNGLNGEFAYQTLVIEDGVEIWNEFGWYTARRYAEYPEGMDEYSSAAKTSIKSAGKKYAKLLEKLLNPKFLGKSNKTIEEIEKEFMSTDYFKDDAWEWAPNAGTDLLWNYWNYTGFWASLKYYFGEISKDEFEENTKYYDRKERW